jgi:hypothetical protein
LLSYKLLEQAIETVRGLPAEVQDELARVLLQLAGKDQPMLQLSAADEASLEESLAQADRREFATAEQVRAIFGRTGHRMSWLSTITEATAGLPIKDAAFRLWIWRHELEFEEKPQGFRKDLGTAREGATFRRLKTLFPRASDQELEKALEAAAKFARDCESQIDWSSKVDQATVVAEIVDRARRDNPGFVDATIEAARRFVHRLIM